VSPSPAPAETPSTAATPAPAPAAKDDARVTPGNGQASRAPAAPAATEAPVDPARRLDDAFQSVQPQVAETAPTLRRAPLPLRRPATIPTATAAREGASMALSMPEPPQLEAPFAEAPRRRQDGRAFSEQRFETGRTAHLPVLARIAQEAKVPIDLADAVVSIESAYDPHAVGGADEIGMMQVRPGTARQLGFSGTAQELFVPETNMRLGVAYLAGAWERAGGNLCQALMKYRAGWDETRMSALSLEYCRRAHVHLTAIGSPLARGVDVRALAARSGARPGQPAAGSGPLALRRGPNGRVTGRFNWAEHDSRIQAIERRFGGQNFGIIAR
jgi:soluble lytic murein transglycosylase-like protein